MMRSLVILLVSFFCLVTVQGTRIDAEKDEAVQNIVDTVITSLEESGDDKTLSQFYEALQDDEGVAKRDQTINNGKLGHCCEAGKLDVSSYQEKDVMIAKPISTGLVRSRVVKCGDLGWNRCTEYYTTYKMHYEAAKVTLKVPVYTCGIEHAICCAGYVSLPNLPGGLAKVSENSCIKSEKAAFVIKQLQLIENVANGKTQLTSDQMDNVFGAETQFFSDNGIQQELSGHCCKAGKLQLSYQEKKATIVTSGSTVQVHSSVIKCGDLGWNRCTQYSSKSKLHYKTVPVTLKVPTYTCGVKHAICCEGYVSMPKLPASLARVGDNSCIKAENRANVIQQLQLMDEVAGGRKQLSPNQMNNIYFAAVTQFFSENGIQRKSK